MKPKTLPELWDEAYKVAHVLADLTEKAHRDPASADHESLSEFTREMNSLALAISNQSKGIQRDTVS